MLLEDYSRLNLNVGILRTAIQWYSKITKTNKGGTPYMLLRDEKKRVHKRVLVSSLFYIILYYLYSL